MWAVFLLPASSSLAGPACCSAGGYSPNIIQGDERALFKFGFDWTNKAAQSDANGSLKTTDFSEDNSLGTSIAATLAATDRLQFGMDFSFAQRQVRRNSNRASSFGARDLRLTASYEAFPQYVYNWWQPRVFVFSTLTAPVGNSMYNSQEELQADALGEGFWATSLGIFATQRWGKWTAQYTGSASYRLKREFETADSPRVDAQPGWTSSHQLSATHLFGRSAWSASGVLGWAWKQGVKTDDGILIIQRGNKTSVDLGASVAYAPSDTQLISLSYNDQSLIPLSTSSDLNRTVALSYSWGIFR